MLLIDWQTAPAADRDHGPAIRAATVALSAGGIAAADGATSRSLAVEETTKTEVHEGCTKNSREGSTRDTQRSFRAVLRTLRVFMVFWPVLAAAVV
jgi:hypothetical protein